MANIMLVEDSEEQRDFFADVLARSGHSVRKVRNGLDALKILEAESFDLILTDVFMPECDGLELIRSLRMGPSGIPVVAMTAGYRDSDELFMRMALKFGADLVLKKSQPPRQIASAIDRLLMERESALQP